MTIEINTLSHACFINPDGEQVCTSYSEEPPVEEAPRKNKLKRKRLIKGSVAEVQNLLNNSPLKNIKSAEELQRTLNKSGYKLVEDGYVGNKTKAALNNYLNKLKKPSTTKVDINKTTPSQNSVDEVYSYPFLNDKNIDEAKYNSWHAWDDIAKRWRDSHKGQRFAEAMKQAGYTYDLNLGRYVDTRQNLAYVPSKQNPERFIIVQADGGNDFINYINPNEIIKNIEFRIKTKQEQAQHLKSREATKQGVKRWNTFMNNNTYKGTYAKTGAKLIKKHSGGGWINQNKHIWDYSDGPNDIQKLIAQYYTNFLNGDSNKQVQNYLKSHQDLAYYLDQAYQKGIDWDKQKTLGNDQSIKYLDYRDSKGNVNFTDKGNKRDQYAKSLGYNNYQDFLNNLDKAGYGHNKAGTQIYHTDSKGNTTYFYAAESPEKGISFINPTTGNIAAVTKRALTPAISQYQKYLAGQSKKDALHSRFSSNWFKVSSLLNLRGHFYDRMIKAGYVYDPKKGTYTKGNDTYSVDNYGNVFKNNKKINSRRLLE